MDPKMDPQEVHKGVKKGPKTDLVPKSPKWTQNGPQMDPTWSQNQPFWSQFGVHFGGLLKVDAPLRQEAIFATFSDPSNMAKSLNIHCFLFEVFAMSTKVWHEASMAPERLQKGSRFGTTMSPNWLRRLSQIRSCFWDAFWSENVSQKGAQHDTRGVHKGVRQGPKNDPRLRAPNGPNMEPKWRKH